MPGRDWKQVKAIFHEALRQEPGERDAFLDTACGGDIELRIEVESLLISLTEAQSFLETPLVKTSAGSYNKWQLNDGEAISHYRILERIGAGGMGEVYLAEDDKLRRRVALKLLPLSMVTDRERLRRFQREALAVSALNHPNILTIFEFDSIDDKHFLASEFVNGETLRARLKRDRVAVEEALEIAIQIASAIQAAHKAGVIHRDIKPENVMIREDGLVKVLDFGLAKVTAESTISVETRAQFLSNPGTLMGTASYMSPEQVRIQPIDKRSDIFSFGVVLYEMLSGRQPFTGSTNTDVIAAILQKEPEQLILKDSGHPAELETLVNKCLEKERTERYQTADELLAELKTLRKRIEAEPRSDGFQSQPEPEAASITTKMPEPVAELTLQRWLPYVVAAFLLSVLAVILRYWLAGQ